MGAHHQSVQAQVQSLPNHPSTAIGMFMAHCSIELRPCGQPSEIIGSRQAKPVLCVVDEALCGRQSTAFVVRFVVVLLHVVQPVAPKEAPLPMVPAQFHEMIGGMRGLRSLIAGPGEVGIVGVGQHLKISRGLPPYSHQHAALVLHTTALAETCCMQGLVVVAVEALHGNQVQRGYEPVGQCVECGQCTTLVHRCLTAKRQSATSVAIVNGHVSERASCRIYLPIALAVCRRLRRCQRLQRQVEAVGECSQSGMPAVVVPSQSQSRQPFRRIVLSLHLRWRPVVAGGQACCNGTVASQRGIDLSVRSKSGQFGLPVQRNGGSSPLQIAGRHTRTMWCDVADRSGYAIQQGTFAKVHVAIHDQSHSQSQSVVAHYEVFQPTQPSQLSI